jgi:hypothetical protein
MELSLGEDPAGAGWTGGDEGSDTMTASSSAATAASPATRREPFIPLGL